MAIKRSDHGIVVQHKETGIRYAVSDRNYRPAIHRKVRDLRAGESVLNYRPKQGPEAPEEPETDTESQGEYDAEQAALDALDQTEGASTEVTEDAK